MKWKVEGVRCMTMHCNFSLKKEMNVKDLYKTLDGQNIRKFESQYEGSHAQSFLKAVLPTSVGKGKVSEDLQKHFTLSKLKRKEAINVHTTTPRHQKTQLSLRERRQLGLYSLPRTGLKFKDYLPLNNLWCDYMRSYLNLDAFRKKRGVGEQESIQLMKADYHGAMVTVSRSRCASLVGCKGILLMDTKNTFRVISEDNIIRTIPKENSMFTIILDDLEFTIFGKHLQIKPIERSTKKIKNRSVSDL